MAFLDQLRFKRLPLAGPPERSEGCLINRNLLCGDAYFETATGGE